MPLSSSMVVSSYGNQKINFFFKMYVDLPSSGVELVKLIQIRGDMENS